jgi:PAS domain S-box-containing protein
MDITVTHDRFRAAFEAAGIGIGIVTEDGLLAEVNDAFARIVGGAPSSSEGAHTSSLSRDPALERLQHELWAGARTAFQVEVELLPRPGAARWARLTASSLDDGSGWVYVVEDVTERTLVERELERTRAELELHAAKLERSNEDLSRFAAVASHDLSEPLRMVTSYVQLIERALGDEVSDDLKTYIDFAVDGAARMRQLIDDVLRYADVGRREAEHHLVELSEVTRWALDDLAPAIAEAEAEIAVGELPVVLGDARELGQLMQNLLANALKFRARNARPSVRVDSRRVGGTWRLTVSDNGIGIEPEQRERVFAMFQRLHARSEYAGTGIGLALCRRIVETHGGRIWVDDGDAEGTSVVLTLPAVA